MFAFLFCFFKHGATDPYLHTHIRLHTIFCSPFSVFLTFRLNTAFLFFFHTHNLMLSHTYTHTADTHRHKNTPLTRSIWYVLEATDVRSPTNIYNAVHHQPSQPFKQRIGQRLSVMLHHSVALHAQVTLFRWRDTLAAVLLHQQSAGLQG